MISRLRVSQCKPQGWEMDSAVGVTLRVSRLGNYFIFATGFRLKVSWRPFVAPDVRPQRTAIFTSP